MPLITKIGHSVIGYSKAIFVSPMLQAIYWSRDLAAWFRGQRPRQSLVYLYVLAPLSVVVPLGILQSAKGGIIELLMADGWSDEQDR